MKVVVPVPDARRRDSGDEQRRAAAEHGGEEPAAGQSHRFTKYLAANTAATIASAISIFTWEPPGVAEMRAGTRTHTPGL